MCIVASGDKEGSSGVNNLGQSDKGLELGIIVSLPCYKFWIFVLGVGRNRKLSRGAGTNIGNGEILAAQKW